MAEQQQVIEKKYSDLVKSVASFGAAAAIQASVSHANKVVTNRKTNSAPKLVNTARNGNFRKVSASPNTRVATYIHENHPDITPSHLTFAGLGLVVGSGIAAYRKPNKSILIAAVPYTAGGIIDGWDGILARLKKLSSVKGMLEDFQADRTQELVTAAVNSSMASREGNRVATIQYAGVAATNTLSSYFRAKSETEGHIVSEDAALFGSRVGRGIGGGVGMGLYNKEIVTNINSALMLSGNLSTAWQRYDVYKKGPASAYYRGHNDDPEFMANAVIRSEAALPFVAAGIATGVALVAMDHVRNRRANNSALEAASNQQFSMTVNEADAHYFPLGYLEL